MNKKIISIPISQINIMNPRTRDHAKFEKVIDSLRTVGMKRPIIVSVRSVKDGETAIYDLVCGQGRIEAFLALGHKTIPAIVIDVPKEERLLMSLVENIARHSPSYQDLSVEIDRLQECGYSLADIGGKLGLPSSHIKGYLTLKKSGEERVLRAALKGKIPVTVAVDIAHADGPDLQRALLDGYEKKQLNREAIRAARRLIEQRNAFGKSLTVNRDRRKTSKMDVHDIIHALDKERKRQILVTRKADKCIEQLAIIEGGFKHLLKDSRFVKLLHEHGLRSLPSQLAIGN